MGDTTANVHVRLAVSGQSQVTSAFGQIQGAVGLLTRAFPALGAALSVGTLTAAAAGLLHLGKQAIDTADNMGKAAQKAGIAVEQFSALAFSADLNDVKQEQLQRATKQLSQTMVEQGRSAGDVREELLSLADTMQRLPDGAAKITLANKALGKSGQEMIPWLSKGRAAIEEEMTIAEKFGLRIGPQFAANANHFNDNLKLMSKAGEGLFLRISDQLLPELVKLTDAIVDLLKNTGALEISVTAVVGLYQEWATKFAALNFAFDVMASSMGAFQGNFSKTKSITEAWAAATNEAEAAGERFAERIAEINKLSEKRNDISPPKPIVPEDEEQRIKRLNEVLKTEQALLDIKIDQQKLKIEQAQGTADDNGIISDAELAKIRAANIEIEKLLGYKRELTNQAFTGTRQPVEGILPAEGPFGAGQDPFIEEPDKAKFDTANQREIDANQRKLRTLEADQKKSAKAIADAEYATNMQRLSATSSMFSDMATAAKAFGKEGFIAYKAFAIAQATIDTAKAAIGAYTSVVSIPYVGPFLAPIAAAAAIAAGAAQISAISSQQPGFREGGYTGNGPRDQVAGQVHRGEWVMPAETVDRYGIGTMAAIQVGSLPTASGPSEERGRKTAMHLHFNKREMKQTIFNSPDWDHQVVEAFKRNRHRMA